MTGTLYLCATPIGNLEDMTYRAVRILQEADLIAAEDTRNSMKLLNHFDIHTPLTSYHEYNKFTKGRELTDKLLAGKNVVLITDAGMPGISDPGEELVAMACEAGIPVTVVPGASACVSALALSALPTRRFAFEAFLPADKKERKAILAELAEESRTIVLYEAPHRLQTSLAELAECLGPDRRASVCRELTKKHETILRTTLRGACEHYAAEQPRGECVIVIEGKSLAEKKAEEQESWRGLSAEEHVALYESEGLDRKEAMRRAAKDRGISKRDIYSELLGR